MRWLIAILIKRYLALAISVITAVSIYDEDMAIIENPAYSPAEALFRKLATRP